MGGKMPVRSCEIFFAVKYIVG